MFKYQKTSEMGSEYLFLFCSKSDLWMELWMTRENIFENTKNKRQK
jgi:hypothetical protein